MNKVDSFIKYQYSPLAGDGSQIRVLELLPGERSDPIEVRLDIIQFDKVHTWDFSALSYTWGSTKDPATVILRSGAISAVLEVTQNLHIALLHLRDEKYVRRLYVDALCIDQDNLKEKSQQVGLMAELYRKAPRVIAWLGPSGQDTKAGLQWIEAISHHVVALPDQRLKALTDDRSWTQANETLDISDAAVQALVDILCRPFFERLWIWQEIRLAEDRCMIVCGAHMVPWLTFRNGVGCVQQTPPSHQSPNMQHLHALSSEIERLSRKIAGSRVLFALNDLRTRKCTDPRDRVYVSLGICRESARFKIVPDYSKTLREVYEDFAARHIGVMANLEILDFVANANSIPGLPSWVPDWSAPRGCRPFDYNLVDAMLSSRGFDCSDHILTVHGQVLSTIKGTVAFGTHPNVMPLPQVLYLLKDFMARVRHQFLFATDVASLISYVDTFFGCRVADAHLPPHSSYPSRSQCISLLKHYLSGSEDGDAQAVHACAIQSFYAAVNGRSFFTAEGGSFGLVPITAKPGDHIVLVAGSQHPLTLRPLPPAASTASYYTLIGPTYMNGNMHLEAILGPLLDEYEVLFRFDDRGSVYLLTDTV